MDEHPIEREGSGDDGLGAGAPQPSDTNLPAGTQNIVFDRLPLSERSYVLSALRQETVGGVLLLIAAVVALIVGEHAAGRLVRRPHRHRGRADSARTSTCRSRSGRPTACSRSSSSSPASSSSASSSLGTLRTPAQAASRSSPRWRHGRARAALRRPSPRSATAMRRRAGASRWRPTSPSRSPCSPSSGRKLPVALRAFLLTLAVVDDLGAIIVIAIFYTDDFSSRWLAIAVALHRRLWLVCSTGASHAWWVYLPLALAVWTFMHASGVHATVAGVALGLLTRVRARPRRDRVPRRPARAPHPSALGRDLRAAVRVLLRGRRPSIGGFGDALTDPVAIAIVVGLVVGKPSASSAAPGWRPGSPAPR